MVMMMENIDEQPRIMHFCKVCQKGFTCGGALGGHMRAHGIEDLNTRKNEEHPMSNFSGKAEGNKPTYFLRTTTNRFVSFRASEDCEKKFLTWNSLVNHGKFSLDTSMEQDLANCLVMLSNGRVDRSRMVAMIENSHTLASEDHEENKAEEVVKKGMFQCKACKKVFNSHQALGGHRASHKKVKGCFAARFDNNGDLDQMVDPPIDLNHTSEAPLVSQCFKRKPKMHKCSICHRVFSSGQALGGHKRCHWVTSNNPDFSFIPKFHGFQFDSQPLFKKPMFQKSEPLDLNLPAVLDEDNPSKFEALTRIYLLPRANEEYIGDNRKNLDASLRDENSEEHVKLAKLSDLKLDGECSTWLQVGIAPSSDE